MYIERSLTPKEAYKLQRNADKIQYAKVTYPLPHDIVKPVLTMSVLEVSAGEYKEEIQQMKNFLHRWSNLEWLRQTRKNNRPGSDILSRHTKEDRDELIKEWRRWKANFPDRKGYLYIKHNYHSVLASLLREWFKIDGPHTIPKFHIFDNKAKQVEARVSHEGKLFVATMCGEGGKLTRFVITPEIDRQGEVTFHRGYLRDSIQQYLGKSNSRSRYTLREKDGEFIFQLDRTGAKKIATITTQLRTVGELAAKTAKDMSVQVLPGDTHLDTQSAIAKMWVLINNMRGRV